VPALSAAAACRNHPTREAIGICVECRSRICTECVTKVDGINYCVTCLGVLAERGARKASIAPSTSAPGVASMWAAAFVLFTTLLTWGLLAVALPGGG
jgi:hypothetical protein